MGKICVKRKWYRKVLENIEYRSEIFGRVVIRPLVIGVLVIGSIGGLMFFSAYNTSKVYTLKGSICSKQLIVGENIKGIKDLKVREECTKEFARCNVQMEKAMGTSKYGLEAIAHLDTLAETDRDMYRLLNKVLVNVKGIRVDDSKETKVHGVADTGAKKKINKTNKTNKTNKGK